MMAQAHLDKYLDVIKHQKVYKRVKVNLQGKATPELAEQHALKYFSNLGTLELFRKVEQTDTAVIFEGLVLVI